MKEMKEKFERKIDVIKIVSLVALLLLIVPSMAAVFIPTPQTFSIKLENYYEMDIKNNRCDCQNINFTERNYDRPECLINQVELSGDYLHFGIDATRNRDNKGEYDKYNLNVIWHDAKLTVYYKETSDDEYKFYKNFSNERGIPGLQFSISHLHPYQTFDKLRYYSCGRNVHFGGAYIYAELRNALPLNHLGDSVLFDIDLWQDEPNTFLLTGKLIESTTNSPERDYLLVFENLRGDKYRDSYLRSLSFFINGKDINGHVFNTHEPANITSNVLADGLTIFNPEGIITIDGTEHDLSSQSELFFEKIEIKKPFWRKEPSLNFKRYEDSIEISGEAGSIKYRGINMVNSFVSDQFPIVAAIISGVLLGIFTFFISMNEEKKKAVFSIIQYIPKENVNLVVTEDGQSFVGEINEDGVLDDKHLFLTKAYVKKAEHNNSEWKKVGDVKISTDKITYIRKSEQ